MPKPRSFHFLRLFVFPEKVHIFENITISVNTYSNLNREKHILKKYIL